MDWQTRQIYEMNEQIKQQIISEITSAVTRTLEDTIKPSMKRALPQEFLDRTTDEAVKRLKSSSIRECNAKGKKIRFEGNSKILKKTIKKLFHRER